MMTTSAATARSRRRTMIIPALTTVRMRYVLTATLERTRYKSRPRKETEMNNPFKESVYNHRVSSKTGVTYVYNARSGDMVKADKRFLNFLDGIQTNEHPERSKAFFKNSRASGFIAASELNEFGASRFRTWQTIFGSRPTYLSFSIVITNQCNYHCDYCFEIAVQKKSGVEQKRGHMTLSTMKQIRKYILKVLSMYPSVQTVYITWFGGEPLCNKNAIGQITGDLLPELEKMHVRYKASIITNGSLITEDTYEMLEKNHVSSVQITFDGERDIYKRFKHATDANFDAAVKAVQDIGGHPKLHLSVRLNVDQSNFDSVMRLLDTFIKTGIPKNASVYMANIVSGNPTDFTQREFNKALGEFLDKMDAAGYGKKALMAAFPHPRYASCGFMEHNSGIIDVDGTIKRCEHYCGASDKTVGDIWKGFYYTDEEYDFIKDDAQEKCHNCSIFPVCRGGCAQQKKDGYNVDCEGRHELEDMLLQRIADSGMKTIDSGSKDTPENFRSN
jgi:uncharacterized protein